MSQYGAAYLRWAPFATTNPEPADALPNYGTPISLGALTKVTDAPTYSEVTADGDNRTQDSLAEFTGGTVDIDTPELENSVAAAIFGATLDESDESLIFSVNDEAPYGGLGFYLNKVKGSKKYFQGIYYPKLKAVPQGREYNTKLKSGVVLTGGKIHFNWEAPEFGKYLYVSEPMDTVEEVKAWVDGKIKAAAT